MSDAVKGGLFVMAAVATGFLVGLLAPQLVGAERETAKRPRAHVAALKTMPDVVSERLDEAQSELDRRGIRYETDAPQFVEMVLPDVLEVCDSEPPAGSGVRGSARLHAELIGTCGA